MEFAPQTHVAKVATRHPGTIRVFQKHGIDFCCGGGRPLSEACEEKGLSFDELQAELASAAAGPAGDERDWETAPLSELIDHIVLRYHDRLRDELPRLAAMAARVLMVHGEKHPEMLRGLVTTFTELRDELEAHTGKEEHALFPYVRELETVAAQGGVFPGSAFGSMATPVTQLEAEHQEAADALAELRRLTDGYQPPTGACTTFRGLFHGLAELESDLHHHVHLENNILFPRAIELEQGIARRAS